MLRNRKGFALVMTMSLLPFLIAGFLLAWATIGLVQQDLALKYACRTEGIEGQKEVGPLLAKLLEKNPRATKLKQELEQVNEAIDAAWASGNTAIIAGLEAKKLIIEGQRAVLDIQQKALIQESNFKLSSAHSKGISEIRSNASKTSNVFIDVSIKNISGQAPRLAVRPDYSDIAPTYSTVPDFTNQQALAHEWQYAVAIQSPFSKFLPGEFEFKKACAISLREDYKEWKPLITKGRFSSKSVW